MKPNDIKKLHIKTKSELEEMLKELSKELFELRMDKSISKNKNVRKYKLVRKDIARLKSIISEKSLVTK